MNSVGQDLPVANLCLRLRLSSPSSLPRRQAGQKAFTLIEVMMAATLLLVGIAGMIYAVTMGSEMLDTAKRSQIAQQIIDGEINRMRLADWGTGVGGVAGTVSYMADSTSSTDFKAIVIDSNGAASGSGIDQFAITNFSTSTTDDNKALLALAKGFTVQLNVASPRANAYRVFSYTVTWTTALGKKYSRRGTTYIGRYGLATSYKR